VTNTETPPPTSDKREKIRNEAPWKVAGVLVLFIAVDIIATKLLGHTTKKLTLILVVASVVLTARTFYYQHGTLPTAYKVALPALTLACVIVGIVLATGGTSSASSSSTGSGTCSPYDQYGRLVHPNCPGAPNFSHTNAPQTEPYQAEPTPEPTQPPTSAVRAVPDGGPAYIQSLREWISFSEYTDGDLIVYGHDACTSGAAGNAEIPSQGRAAMNAVQESAPHLESRDVALVVDAAAKYLC
jgi:hypothetical protein